MRFLIIDDDADYRGMLRYHLEVEWPDAVLDEYRPRSMGEMPAGFVLAHYDAVLLAQPVAGEPDRLTELLRRPACPPVFVFAEPSDEFLAVDAVKAGAASYFPKSRVTHQRLIGTLRQELAAAADHPAPGALRAAPRDYRILDTLHASDMVNVYLAEADDQDQPRPMAVKVIRYVPDAGGGRLFDRFVQEYEVIARVEHRGVVEIFDFGVADDHAYIAMEYLPGGSLADRLRAALGPESAVDYARQIASALEAIHNAGVLHRDLKPANIMFRDDGSLALIDFGLAKSLTLDAAITGAGQIFGTPYYMSPEQGHAEQTDRRSDVYSLGCVFYEMLTGKRPFTAGSAMGVIYRHAQAPRPRLEGRAACLQPVLDRMLAVDPDARYASAAELLEDLAAH